MLQLKNICYSVKTDEGKKPILTDVSVDFADGEQTIITGHNGSGKTTLAKIVMGILVPDSGTILFDGRDITALSVTERAKAGIAYAFQQPVRFKGLHVSDLLEAAGGKRTRAELCDWLSEVGLCAADYIDRELNGELSGGEIKRIEIAMALLRNCRVSVFDEPEAGIDIWSFDNIVGVFSKLKGNGRITILVSHQERIMRAADKLVLLNSGRVEAIGAPEVMLKKIHGATPYCRRLGGAKCN